MGKYTQYEVALDPSPVPSKVTRGYWKPEKDGIKTIAGKVLSVEPSKFGRAAIIEIDEGETIGVDLTEKSRFEGIWERAGVRVGDVVTISWLGREGPGPRDAHIWGLKIQERGFADDIPLETI